MSDDQAPWWRILIAPTHPVWKLAQQTSLIAAVLFVTASDFDLSELKTLAGYLGAAGGLEFLRRR